MQLATRQTIRIFWDHTKKYRWQMIAVLFGMLIVPLFQVYTPLRYRDLIDVIAAGDAGMFDRAIHLVFLILFLNVVQTLSRRVMNLVSNFLEPAVMRDLSNTVFEYVQKHSYGFFTSNFVGSLVTRARRYERAYERLADLFVYDMGNSILLTGSVIAVLLYQYPLFGWIVLGWTVLFMVISYLLAQWKLPYDIKRAATDSHVTGQLADSITNNINIKLFTGYEREGGRFRGATQDQFAIRKKSTDLGTLSDAIQSFLMIGLEFVLLYLALGMWRDGVLTAGDFALIQAFLIRIFDKLWNTGKHLRMMFEALADANEMTEIMLKPHGVVDMGGASALQVDRGAITFDRVGFSYKDGAEVFKQFSLNVKPGERIALIGPSGGGKSTILKLLLRFYDVQSGTITIDGQNIAAVSQDSLRSAIALVPQDPILFHRSLMENIRYARPEASDDEVVEAARLAHAHEFITKFPQGYETLVGERGIKLSGGERQRVAIARAILKNAPILILDEATSSLDSESEKLIQDALTRLMKGRTTIVVAHRLSTINQMDRILVIENGAVVEQGTHHELLKVSQGVYQKLWDIQVGGFSSA